MAAETWMEDRSKTALDGGQKKVQAGDEGVKQTISFRLRVKLSLGWKRK